MYKLGEQLTKARLAAGITQEKLADEVKVTRQTISSWERDNSQPDLGFVVALSKALNCEFDLDDSIAIGPKSGGDSPETNHQSTPGRKRLPAVIGFIAGALAAVLIMLCISPLFGSAPQPGYTIPRNAPEHAAPNTVQAFRQASIPHEGKPYVVISFSENPVYAKRSEMFDNGFGWRYTVYLTEQNSRDFYPESYTMYYFSNETTSVTFEYGLEDLKMWWGENLIPARGQQCVRGGEPVQEIIGIGIKLSGKDANGETMDFYGYMECSQEIRE